MRMMPRPPRMPWPANPLDRILQNWQHRWETNRQFRAVWSGVAGLVIVVSLCACMGAVSTLVTHTVAGFTGANNTSANQLATQGQGSGGQIGAAQSFPTFTAPALPQPSYPAVDKIPNSQTPMPSPTAQPTATAAPTATDGGGFGGPLVCSGGGSGGNWSLSPCPQIHGQTGTLTIVDHGQAGKAINVVLDFCESNCALLFTPAQGYKLDGSGTVSISYTVPNNAANSPVGITGMINITGGPTIGITASAAQ